MMRSQPIKRLSDSNWWQRNHTGTASPTQVEANDLATILIVDDDPTTVATIKLILEGTAEYCVLVARSGPECFRQVEQVRPDLILLDILMPGMNGIEVLKRLQSRPDTQSIPILMVSVDAQLERMATCFELGANGFLIKPFDAASLYQQVRNTVARRRTVILQKHQDLH